MREKRRKKFNFAFHFRAEKKKWNKIHFKAAREAFVEHIGMAFAHTASERILLGHKRLDGYAQSSKAEKRSLDMAPIGGAAWARVKSTLAENLL